MSEQPLSLPAAVSSAIEKYAQAKTSYLEVRDRLVSLANRIEKHRKTASAASEESTLAGSAWRRQFRESDGVLSKDIRDLKRKELDARELAEEYTNLASELQPQFDLCQLDTAAAREACGNARNEAKRLYADHSLEQSAEALFKLPEAQRLIDTLERKGLVLPASNEPSQARRMAPDEIEAHETAKSERLRKLGEVVQRLINRARKHGRSGEDPTWQGLQAISKLSIETLPSQLTGPLTINRRRKELNAQLMASAAS